MDIEEKLDSARIVYTLGLWAPGCLESGRWEPGRLVLRKLNTWRWLDPKNYNCILPSKAQPLIMIRLIAGFSFLKMKAFLLESGRGLKCF